MTPIIVSATAPTYEHSPSLGVRSPHWPAVERAHLESEPACQVCGTMDDLNVHHCRPFHLHPDLELNPANLITLCRNHHLWWGHLGCWRSWNCHVQSDCETWRDKIKNRPA